MLSCIGVLIASYYPLSMGVRVISDMISTGSVLKENYPKYIIPYTPICLAVLIGVLLMPLCIKLLKKFALVGGASIGAGIFFAFELFFEQKVVVATAETVTKLEDWQMYMCYMPPEGWGETVTTYKTQTAVDILMGDYNPAFKMHFYVISIVLIITILNCLYGFGQMVKTGEKSRTKSLVLQSVCSLAFLGLCILACFTAFWRDGSIEVSPLSAALMTVFFVLLGVTVGVFVGSFLLGKSNFVSVWVPGVAASAMTLLMYIGEMILLNGHLYSFGSGFIFESLPGIVLAPIDLLIIMVSGGVTALMLFLLNGHRAYSKKSDKMKKKSLTIILSVIGAVVALVLVVCAVVIGSRSGSKSGGIDEPGRTVDTVQIIEKASDTEESSYRVGAALHGTDFSSVGQTLTDKIKKEWEDYDSMTREQQLLSSKLWGLVDIQADTWDECEEAIGIMVDNPLESLDWLNKTGYFGMDSTDPTTPLAHVQATAYAMRKLSQINITAGYNTGSVRVTITATLSANSEMFTAGSVCNGYATYEQNTADTSSGIPVLIVTADGTNNNGYYNGNCFDSTAYWVKDNVFYTLRVFGEDADQAEIQAALSRILEEN